MREKERRAVETKEACIRIRNLLILMRVGAPTPPRSHARLRVEVSGIRGGIRGERHSGGGGER